jgi:histone H1/5
MSIVREFNPPSRLRGGRQPAGRYRAPISPSGIYRPSFAVGRDASDIVRDRLRQLKIGKSAPHGRVLLNNRDRDQGGLRANASAVAEPPTRKPAAKKPAAKAKPKKPAGKASRACAKRGIRIPEAKARKMLHDGKAQGKPLTAKQRGLMGLVAGGCKMPQGKAARKRAEGYIADAKKEAEAKKARKAKKAAKAKPKKAAAKKAKKAAKPKKAAKKPAKKAAKKAAKKTKKPRRWKGSVKGQISVSGSRELVPAKTKAKAASAGAKKAKAAPAKAKSRRQPVAAKTKSAGRKKSAKAKHKKQNKHKKHNKAKKHNKGKKRKKNQQQSAGDYEGAVRVNKGKKRNKKRGRRNTPEGTAKTLKALGVSSKEQIPLAIKNLVIRDRNERRNRELDKKLESVLNKLTKIGGYDRDPGKTEYGLADLIAQLGLSQKKERRKVGSASSAAKRGAKRRAAEKKATAKAAEEIEKKAKKGKKAKKHNKKKAKSKKAKSKKAKGSKKGKAKKAKGKGKSKKAKGSKKGKTKKAKKPARLAGSIKGSVELHELRRNKKKRRNQGAVSLTQNIGLPAFLDKPVGFVKESIWAPIKDNASGVVGLGIGVAGSYGVQCYLMSDFAKKGWWQKLLATAVGGVTGIAVTGLVAPLVVSEEEARRQVAFSAVGALGALLSTAITKATKPDNMIRCLIGTDPLALADYVGLNDDVSPRKVKEEPKGLPVAPEPAPDAWSSALDYGDAKFDPIGFEPDMFSDSSIMDFASPAANMGDEGMGAPWDGKAERGSWNTGGAMGDDLGDFASPQMSDFAETALADESQASGMADELADFASPAMGDFVGVVNQ